MALTNKQKDRLLELQSKIMEVQEEIASFMEDAEQGSKDEGALEYCWDKLDDAYIKLGHFG